MRRYALLVLAVSAAFAIAAPAASAAGPPATHGGPLPGNPSAGSLPLVPGVPSIPSRVVTATDVVARAAAIQGIVYGYSGAAIPNADVEWGHTDATGWHYGGSTSTDTTGAFQFSDVTPTAQGDVGIWYKDGPSLDWRALQWTGLTFPDGSALDCTTQPGRIPWSASRGGDWKSWAYPTVVFENPGASSAATDFTFDTSGTESGAAEALPGTVSYGCMYFWWDEADESYGWSRAVSAGATAGSAVAFVENDALRSFIESPWWWSCRPGDYVRISHGGWPAGYTASFRGWSDSPNGATTTFNDRTWTSMTTDWSYGLRFRIPSTAKAGYGYVLATLRTDKPDSSLMLREYIQLATLKKAAASGGIRLSGVVPTRGHWGSTRGIRKPVIIYAKTRKAGVPKRWDPRSLGWRKVASLRCSGLGKYRTGILRPTRDTWYVARYKGDNWYWGAFTNVVNVRR